jgi:iron(III) transport system permease protein
LALLAGFVLFFAIWPLGRLFFEGFAPLGVFDPNFILESLDSKSVHNAVWHSLETSFMGMLGALIFGGATAFIIALTNVRLKLGLVLCFMLPMMIPPQITALSWIQLFGPSSALLNTLGMAPEPGTPNPIYSRAGIILLLSLQHAPLAFLIFRTSFKQIPRELIEAARLAGAGPLRITSSVVLPLLAPAVLASAELTFVSSLGNFGIPAMLGIPKSYYVLPTMIYRRLASFGPSIIAEIAVLAMVTALIGIMVVTIFNYVTRNISSSCVAKPGAALSFELGAWRIPLEITLWALIFTVLVLPFTALVAASLVPAYGVALSLDTITLENFIEVLLRQDAVRRAFANSGGLAAMASLILALVSLPLGYFIVWRKLKLAKLLATLVEMPYALPGVVLAIAMILVFLKPLPILDISLYGTMWIILAAYLARFLALGLRPVIAGFQQVSVQLEEAGKTCGSGFFMRLGTITAPLMGPVAAAGAILVFMTAFNELTVSALLWSAGNETLGVIVFNLDDGGYSVLASAVAVLVVIIVFLLMLLTQALSRILPPGVLPWSDSNPR